MEHDIVPELLKKIKKDFYDHAEKSGELEKLLLLLKDGKATYKESYRFATKIGEILSTALQENINNDVLPEGKMHFNIANRILNEMLETNHKMVSSYAKNIQEELNKQAGLGLKSVIAPINQDRIDGLVNRLSHESSFDDVSWILGAPVVNFSQNVVDNHIKANAEFHYKSGLKAKVIRTTNGKCCDWCDKLAGVYFYPKVDKDVFRRHDRCDCTVEYYPGDGKKQDVWSKQWSNEKTKQQNKNTTNTNDIAKGNHEREIGLDLEKRGKIKNIIRDPTGKAEFIENNGNGQKWDIKSFNSNYPPRKGGFKLERDFAKILNEIKQGENVIVETTNMSSEHINALKNEINKIGLKTNVIFWP